MVYSNFSEAPCGVPLTIIRITDSQLESRFAKMGIFPACEVIRLDEEIALHTVRVRGPKGEIVLGGGMGGKIVIHLEDGRMIPLTEMVPGERGHIETVTAGNALMKALAALGLRNDDQIELIRRLPPMEYITRIEGRGRIRLAEGMAAKILGRMGKVECQFANAQAHVDFTVLQILGGMRARRAVASLDIHEGCILQLEAVRKAFSYRMTGGERFIISSQEGLRLFLRRDQADLVIVNSAIEKEQGC